MQEEKEANEKKEADRLAVMASFARGGTSFARGGASSSSAAAAAASSSTASSHAAAALQAAAAAYNAIPAVQKPPAAAAASTSFATSASSSAAAAAAPSHSHAYSSTPQPGWSATSNVKSEENEDESIGRPKDDRDYEEQPRIKDDPEEEKDDDVIIGGTTGEAGTDSSSSFWAAAKIKQEMHEEWRQEVEERKEKENEKMNDHVDGKAYMFVERVLEKHRELATGNPIIDSLTSAVARDDMVFMAIKMLQLHESFSSDLKPSRVDIGYHYTRPENMDRIRTDGLMTHAERTAHSVGALHNGSAFGDGVYTGNNPFAFKSFGEAGLVVARLKGNAERRGLDLGRAPRRGPSPDVDTVIGNKGLGLVTRYRRGRRLASGEEEEDEDQFDDEVVLQSSYQCVPLVRFHSSLASGHYMEAAGTRIIHSLHRAMQEVVDEFFNGGRDTKVEHYTGIPISAPSVPAAVMPGPFAPIPIPMPVPLVLPGGGGGASFGMPFGIPGLGRFAGVGHRLGQSSPFAEIEFVAPYVLEAPECAYEEAEVAECDGECIICFEPLCSKHETPAKVKICGHLFHKACIEESLKHKNRCPMCRKTIGEVRGQMPSGTMSISRSKVKCKGYENCRGSLVIRYDIPPGLQRMYMVNPQQPHAGKSDTAYLPDSKVGRLLLERLKYAFSRGLTFVVGTSATTGQNNVVTWNSIHHKTSPSGGPHGFPDPNYIDNCNSELDNLGVPTSEECKEKNGGDDEDEDAIVIE